MTGAEKQNPHFSRDQLDRWQRQDQQNRQRLEREASERESNKGDAPLGCSLWLGPPDKPR
jgi:hypothetical protein